MVSLYTFYRIPYHIPGRFYVVERF